MSLSPQDEAHLEAIVEAFLQGHELGEWLQVENGWQAACKICGSTTWIGQSKQAGLRYSLLADECIGRKGPE